jgi:hypothetical protein
MLETALGNNALRPAAIEALTVRLYSEDRTRHRAAILLLRAKPALFDPLILALNELGQWQPWIPLALAALTEQREAIAIEAQRLSCMSLFNLMNDHEARALR